MHEELDDKAFQTLVERPWIQEDPPEQKPSIYEQAISIIADPKYSEVGVMSHMLALLIKTLEESQSISLFDDIKEFHYKFKIHPAKNKPHWPPVTNKKFRDDFLEEEFEEYRSAKTLEDAFDALIDIVYVALGTAYLFGFDFNEGWRRVHEANMRKVRAKSSKESKRGSSYDVIKPEGWQPPNLSDLT